MKILQVIHKPQHRGAEIFACQLSGHLISLGHQVKMVSIFEGEADLPFDGEINSLKASPAKRFFDLAAWRRLDGIVRKFEPDVIQANAGDSLKYIVLSKNIFRWKVPVVSRNASEIGRYLKSYLHKQLNGYFYRGAEKVLSVSRASEKDILNHFPFLKNRTEVIPVGLEEISGQDQVQLKPRNKKHIVHVGGFTFEKNHKGLLKIFNEILSKENNIHLHLLGDGPLRTEIEKQASRMKLQNQIHFYGFVNNPLSYIRGADVLVLPSIIEGLPGVLLEAMYCKIPVVAYNVGGISEIVKEDTGNLIKKGDESAFAKAVLQTLTTKNDKQIERAFKLVHHEFMNKQIALKFVNSYLNIVAHQQ